VDLKSYLQQNCKAIDPDLAQRFNTLSDQKQLALLKLDRLMQQVVRVQVS
jgi:hypothetical protein